MVRMGGASMRARQIPADSRYRHDDLSRTGCTSPDYYLLTSGDERRVARALSPAALSSRSLGQSRSVTSTKGGVTVQHEDGRVEAMPLDEARAFLDAMPIERRALYEDV